MKMKRKLENSKIVGFMGIDASLYTYQTPSKSPKFEDSQALHGFWHGPETGERKEEAHWLSITQSLAIDFASILMQSACILQTVLKIGLLSGQIHDLPVTEHVRRLAGMSPTTSCQDVSEWGVSVGLPLRISHIGPEDQINLDPVESYSYQTIYPRLRRGCLRVEGKRESRFSFMWKEKTVYTWIMNKLDVPIRCNPPKHRAGANRLETSSIRIPKR